MKEKILFVNSCVRGDNESRTLALAKTALSRLDGDIEEIRLADANLKPLDARRKRGKKRLFRPGL